MTPDWERQELPSLLCPFYLWMGSANRGEAFLPCLPMLVAEVQCGASWPVEVLALSQLPSGVAGARGTYWGLFR